MLIILLLLLISSPVYAGISFGNMAMSTTYVGTDSSRRVDGGVLTAGLNVCIAIVVKDKGLVHLLPAFGTATDRREDQIMGISTKEASLRRIKRLLDNIQYSKYDDVYIFHQEDTFYGTYTINKPLLQLMFPQAKFIKYSGITKVFMSSGSLWYENNGKTEVVYGQGATVYAGSRPVSVHELAEFRESQKMAGGN